MYTTKEVAEVEDRIYATVNTKIRVGSNQNAVGMSGLQLDTIGVGQGRDRHHGDNYNMFQNNQNEARVTYKGKTFIAKRDPFQNSKVGNYDSVSRSQHL